MPIEILMPALSPTMEKGNLAKWLKKEGDKVAPGDVIAEIETDKATMEVEAIDEGTLAKIVVPEGAQDVPVNQLIAVLATGSEDAKAVAAGGAAAPAPKPAEAPKAEAPKAAEPAAASCTRSGGGSRSRRDGRQRPCRRARLLLAAGASPGEGSRHRRLQGEGLRSARPRRRRGHRRRQGRRHRCRGCCAGVGSGTRRQALAGLRAVRPLGRPDQGLLRAGLLSRRSRSIRCAASSPSA